MSKLTIDQNNFLTKHKISLGCVFDATGLGKKEYCAAMKQLGKDVALGVTPCKKEKHTLRTRHGHCVQCNPANLAFQKRHSMQGFVYVAGSLKLSVIKVGLSSDTNARMVNLNSLKYAGADDWKCLYWVETKNAGSVEFKTHKALEEFASPKTYKRNQQIIDCLETFSCSATKAISEVINHSGDILKEWKDSTFLKKYEFSSKSGESFVRKKGENYDGIATPLYRSKTIKQDIKQNEGKADRSTFVDSSVYIKPAKNIPPKLPNNPLINSIASNKTTEPQKNTEKEEKKFSSFTLCLVIMLIIVLLRSF